MRGKMEQKCGMEVHMPEPTISASVIDERVKRLRKRIRDLDRLRIELETLESLRIRAIADQQARQSRRLGPTRAVELFLRDQPRKRSEVVNVLSGTVQTRSNDVRRVIYTTIGTLERRGRVVERDGCLHMVDQRKENLVTA